MAKVFFHIYKKEGKTGAYLTEKPQPPGIRAESSIEIEVDDKLAEHNFGLFIDKIANPAGTAGQWLDNAKMEDFVEAMEDRDDELEKAGKNPETGKSGGGKKEPTSAKGGAQKAYGMMDDNISAKVEEVAHQTVAELDKLEQKNWGAHSKTAIQYVKNHINGLIRSAYTIEEAVEPEPAPDNTGDEKIDPKGISEFAQYEAIRTTLEKIFFTPLEKMQHEITDEKQKNTLEQFIASAYKLISGEQLKGHFDLTDEEKKAEPGKEDTGEEDTGEYEDATEETDMAWAKKIFNYIDNVPPKKAIPLAKAIDIMKQAQAHDYDDEDGKMQADIARHMVSKNKKQFEKWCAENMKQPEKGKTPPAQSKKVDSMVNAGKSSEEIAKTIKPTEDKPTPEQAKPATPTAPEQNKPADSKMMQKAKSVAPKMEKEIQDRINELPEEDRQYALDMLKNVMGVLK